MGQREALLAVPFHYARAPEPSCTGELPSAIGSCPNLYDTFDSLATAIRLMYLYFTSTMQARYSFQYVVQA